MSLARTLGHTLLATMFIRGGASAFEKPDGRAKKVEAAGIPLARQAVILNGAAMVIGGVGLAMNLFPKLSATVLAGTLIPTTFVGHPYWQEQPGQARANQQIHFWKNLAMLGGLLLVLGEKK